MKGTVADGTKLSRGETVQADTLGAAWLAVARLILERGTPSHWDGLPFIEIERVTLDVARPDPEDGLIARHASAEWLDWMRTNFTTRARVAALGDARSYASRIFDYGGAGRDQLGWIIEKLRRNPAASDATITTFEPLSDTTYIPCVSLLDFWVRSDRLELVVYAHSIDFGKKGFGNLVQLAALQQHVAASLGRAIGALVIIIKSAHIYTTECDAMSGLVRAAANA